VTGSEDVVRVWVEDTGDGFGSRARKRAGLGLMSVEDFEYSVRSLFV
jgi:hypothetical protein